MCGPLDVYPQCVLVCWNGLAGDGSFEQYSDVIDGVWGGGARRPHHVPEKLFPDPLDGRGCSVAGCVALHKDRVAVRKVAINTRQEVLLQDRGVAGGVEVPLDRDEAA